MKIITGFIFKTSFDIMSKYPIALTIAGSDSGGGAGIQADIKSFSANGVYGASVITAITAQNTVAVTAIHNVPVDIITAQLDAVFDDLNITCVKIGMLSKSETIKAVAAVLKKHRAKNKNLTIVLDPVMVTTTGDPLIADDAVDTLKEVLLPLATLVTPNLHETARLINAKLPQSREEMVDQAQQILNMGVKAVLIKGGHGASNEALKESTDLLLLADGSKFVEEWFTAKWVVTKNTHGTGCSLSSAITANLAKGETLSSAIQNAKTWLTGAIASADDLDVGKGSGPVHHFYQYWK